jgi:hypothetical protein
MKKLNDDMIPDDIEKKLQRQPVRVVPREWREEILQAARSSSRAESAMGEPAAFSWRSVFWPCPQAWAGLAAIWVVLAAVNFTGGREPVSIAANPAPPSREYLTALKQQQRELNELINPGEAQAAEPPKHSTPGRRGERRTTMVWA